MRGYLVHRLLLALITLLGVSLAVFGSVRAIPGDPAETIAGQFATPEVVAQIRSSLGLDQPFWQQYGAFLNDLARGDLGYSLRSGLPVNDELAARLGYTLLLAATSTALALLAGAALGYLSTLRPHSALDSGAMATAVLGVSMPVFWLGLMLMLLFSVVLPRSLGLDGPLLPPTGAGSWRHLVLPALTQAAAPMAIIARMTRATLLEALRQDYVRTARAKGLREGRVRLCHAMRNALIPVVTVVGLQAGYMLGGAVLTETVFNWPGLGTLLVNAVLARDYPVVQGATLVIAVGIVAANLAVDLLYSVLDPRIQYR